MKITPDSSLFSALSNLPGPKDVHRGARVEGQAAFAEKVQSSKGKAEKDARDAIVRQALREAAQRQASLRQSQASAAPAATNGVAPALSAESSGQAGLVKREAPFAESRPHFVRLGQFIDIQV